MNATMLYECVNVTLDHKTSLKSLGYICSNSQKYIVWVKIDFSFGSFPPSGTGQYSTVRFGTEHPDPACVSTANSTLYLIGVVYTGK